MKLVLLFSVIFLQSGLSEEVSFTKVLVDPELFVNETKLRSELSRVFQGSEAEFYVYSKKRIFGLFRIKHEIYSHILIIYPSAYPTYSEVKIRGESHKNMKNFDVAKVSTGVKVIPSVDSNEEAKVIPRDKAKFTTLGFLFKKESFEGEVKMMFKFSSDFEGKEGEYILNSFKTKDGDWSASIGFK